MTLLKIQLFQQTWMGRMLNIALILAIFNLNSCTVYKASATSLDKVSTTEQVLNNMHIYRFFVHDGYSSYQLINPGFSAEGHLTGKLVPTRYATPDTTWTKKERKAYWKEHKYDINIFTETVLTDLQASLGEMTGNNSKEVTITNDMITKMTITSVDREAQTSDAAMVILGILAVAVVVVLIILLLGSMDTDGGGGEGSGSGSGSGSD
jgi:hypothetical protein